MDIGAKTDAFVAKYNGTHIDEDGYYGAQCWDVSARFAREMLGCPSFPTGSGGAEGLYRIFAQPIPQFFDRIANNPNDKNQVPQKGDIIVYNASFSPPWGHTALVISATSSSIRVLEQNGNVPGGNAYITNRGYTNIYGWLRPKGGAMADKPTITTLRIAQSEIVGTERGYAHGGQFDQKMIDAHGFKEVNAFIYEMWLAGGDYRNLKDKWKAFYDNNKAIGEQLTLANSTIAGLKTQIDELGKRPTAAELEALKASATDANNKAMAAQAELEKVAAERAEEAETGSRFVRWIGSILSKLKPGS